MKKNIRLIIIVCAAAVLLGGAALLLALTAPEKEEEAAPEKEVTSSLLYDKNPADLEKLTVENENGSYEVVRLGEGDSAVWAVPAYINFPLDSSFIKKLTENASTVTAQQTVTEAPEDISIYGLDKPSATVTAEFSDSAKTVKKIIIGNKTPDEGKRYIMLDGSAKVYTVPDLKYSCYTEDRHRVISKVIQKVRGEGGGADTEDGSAIKKLEIYRADLDYDIIIEYDTREDDENNMIANSSAYIMTSPVFRDINPDKGQSVVQGALALTANDFAVLNPVESDYEKCGLDEPAAEIKLETLSGDTLRLRIGGVFTDEEGKKAGRYVCADGTDIIYIFDESSLPWLTVRPLDIVTTLYTSHYVYGLETLDITAGAKKLHFTFSGSDAKDFAVKLNGADTDADRFKTLYQFILSAPSTELCLEEASGQPALAVDIKAKDGGSDLIEFIPAGSRQVIVRLNGESAYRCAEAYVERFIKNLELFENGEDIISSW